MGCCSNRPVQKEKLIEKTIFRPLIDDLKLCLVNSKKFCEEVTKKSTNSHITDFQLKDICNKFEMDADKHWSFYSCFINSGKVNSIKFKTLGIILGQGIISEKVKILYENYNIDTSYTITKTDLELLLSDIITINCIYLPSYVISYYPDRDDLRIYADKLRQMIKGLVNHYLKIFMGRKQEISYEDFTNYFESDIIEFLLKDGKFRRHAYKIYLQIMIPIEFVKKSLNNPISISINKVNENSKFIQNENLDHY